MRTQVLAAPAAYTFHHAADVLRLGGVVALPTDTVYGIAARIDQPEAIRSLYTIKGRSSKKAIAILLAALEQLDSVAIEIPGSARRLAGEFWPGGLTLILRRNPDLPREISQSETIGLRVPDHPIALELLRETGPLAVTSANLSGDPNSLNAAAVHEKLNGRIPLIIDGGTVPGGLASTVCDCTVVPPTVRRSGPVTQEEIDVVLAGLPSPQA